MVKRAVRVSDRQIGISRVQLEGLGGQIYGQEGRGSEKPIGGLRGQLEGLRGQLEDLGASQRVWEASPGGQEGQALLVIVKIKNLQT